MYGVLVTSCTYSTVREMLQPECIMRTQEDCVETERSLVYYLHV